MQASCAARLFASPSRLIMTSRARSQRAPDRRLSTAFCRVISSSGEGRWIDSLPATKDVGHHPWGRVLGFVHHFHTASTVSASKVFEPDYLDDMAKEPARYPLTNIQIKGYNFDVLESYQTFIHKTCENIGIEVQEAWATPFTTQEVKTFMEGGTVVKESYQINLYERNVQIANARTLDIPQLFDILRIALPEGVELSVHEHTEEHYEARYIPDAFVNTIKKELAELEDKDYELKEKRKEKALEKEKRKAAMLLASLEDD